MIDNKKLIKLIKNNIDIKQNYEKLYLQNRGFVHKVIKNRVYGIYEIEDLLQIAFLAMVNAVNLYDDTKEYSSFLELFKYCIWNELRSSQRELPVHIKKEIRHYKITYNKLYEENGEKPSDKKMMLEMNITLDKLYKIKHAMQSNISIDSPIIENSETTIKDIIVDEKAHEIAQEELEKDDLTKIINEALKKLNDEEQEFIDNKYYRNLTLETTGQQMNISKNRARQIEVNAINKLKNDRKFRNKVVDYTSLNEYKKVGVNEFNRTWTSATEWLVLKREGIRERL